MGYKNVSQPFNRLYVIPLLFNSTPPCLYIDLIRLGVVLTYHNGSFLLLIYRINVLIYFCWVISLLFILRTHTHTAHAHTDCCIIRVRTKRKRCIMTITPLKRVVDTHTPQLFVQSNTSLSQVKLN